MTSHILLIHHLISRGRPTLTLPFPMGVTMSAAWFSTMTGNHEPEFEYSLKGPVTIHLAAARPFPGWCYLQLWDAQAGCYSCTCSERSQGDCLHTIHLEHPERLVS